TFAYIFVLRVAAGQLLGCALRTAGNRIGLKEPVSGDDQGKNKTVVTVVSRLSDKPVAKEACLVVIYGTDLGRKFNLDQPALVIGRSSKSDVQVDQESVSRSHAKIINTGKTVILRDLGSTNGTYVNDELIDEYVLRDGDFIKIGRTIFKFLSGGNIEN